MASWVRQRAEQVQKEEERRQQEREWAIAQEKIVARKIRPLWEQLVACVTQDVAEINKEFAFDRSRETEFFISENPCKIVVYKSRYPAVRLTASLDEERHSINVLYATTQHDHAPTYERKLSIKFHLDDKGDLYLTQERPMTCSEASQFLLEQVISPAKDFL